MARTADERLNVQMTALIRFARQIAASTQNQLRLSSIR